MQIDNAVRFSTIWANGVGAPNGH